MNWKYHEPKFNFNMQSLSLLLQKLSLYYKKKEKINICFTVDKNYVEYCGTTIVSILMNSDSFICFYIVNSDLDYNDKEKIKKIKQIKDFEINFIDVNERDFSRCYVPEGTHFRPANYFRLKLASLLPEVDKIIYLDSDTVAIKDIKGLWREAFNGSYVIGCKSMMHEKNCARLGLKKGSPYINSGVMVLNLKKIRKDNIEKMFFECIEAQPEIMKNVDQDVINVVLLDKPGYIKNVRQNWNTEVRTDQPFKKEYVPIVENPYIIHYLTSDKPWKEDSKQIYKGKFLKYNKVFKKLDKKYFK